MPFQPDQLSLEILADIYKEAFSDPNAANVIVRGGNSVCEIKSKYGAWPVLLSRGENEINFQTRIRLKQLPVNVIYQTVYELNHAMPKIKFVLVQNNPNDPRIDLSLNYLMFESQIIDSDILVALFHVFDESVEIVFDAIGELIDN